MLQAGTKQTLIVIKKVEFGVYLAPEEKEDGSAQERETQQVLLPKKEVPKDCETGSRLEVFLYLDSKDRLIATTREPVMQLGQIGLLKVRQMTKIGAFLDWGLEKDLFLPFKQQTRKVSEGDEVLTALYTDKSGRLCATMNVYPYLLQDSPFRKDDTVTGVIYETSEEFGLFVAVQGPLAAADTGEIAEKPVSFTYYSGLIPRKEADPRLKIGDVIEARVTRVKPDGKLDLSTRQKAYLQIDTDAQEVLKAIHEFSGVLPFNDKANPAVILRELGMSKNAFKRAVGSLLKSGQIEIGEHSIRLCSKED